MDNIYFSLTREFNRGGVRAIISSGQAVVLHRLAVMSKDGDWIVREDPVELGFVLGVLENLLKVKLTQREKDYAVIGELARKLPLERQLLYGRSSRDLIALAAESPETAMRLAQSRPLLAHALEGDRDALETELDKERRRFMRADENRLDVYARAASEWRARWPGMQSELRGIPLNRAHSKILQAAEGVLPYSPEVDEK